jgi:hypothetical protein
MFKNEGQMSIRMSRRLTKEGDDECAEWYKYSQDGVELLL